MILATFFRLLRSFFNDLTLVTGVILGIMAIGRGGSVWEIAFGVFFALWLIFGRRYVYWIKSRRQSLGKIRHDLFLALFRGVVTALAVFYVYWTQIEGGRDCYPFGGAVALLALSVIPVNMGIDQLERKYGK